MYIITFFTSPFNSSSPIQQIRAIHCSYNEVLYDVCHAIIVFSCYLSELLITAGGENVPPVPIEDKAKEELPIISNAMLIGDKKKFLAMLLTLKVIIEPIRIESLLLSCILWKKLRGFEGLRYQT